MVRVTPHFAKTHGHIPTDCDEARHELRWWTVRWVMRFAWEGGGLDPLKPQNFDAYLRDDAVPWTRSPAEVVADLRVICARVSLWRDRVNDDIANSPRTFEQVVHRRIDTWTEVAFQDLVDRLRELEQLGADPTVPFAHFRDICNHEARQARLQARLDVLDAEVAAAQLVDIERDANEALGTW